MLKFLALSMVLFSFSQQTYAFVSPYEECLFSAFVEHDLEVRDTRLKRDEDVKECLQFSYSEEYEKCVYMANKEFQDQSKKFQGILNLKKRGCMKMPYSY